MNILVTGANGQLGNEMQICSKGSGDTYIKATFGVEVPYWTDSLRKCIERLK